MTDLLFPPVRDIDYREAEEVLILYLKSKGMVIKNCRGWARWTYSDIPFWSVWGIVYGGETARFDYCGIHIHDDGKVLIVYSKSDAVELIDG